MSLQLGLTGRTVGSRTGGLYQKPPRLLVVGRCRSLRLGGGIPVRGTGGVVCCGRSRKGGYRQLAVCRCFEQAQVFGEGRSVGRDRYWRWSGEQRNPATPLSGIASLSRLLAGGRDLGDGGITLLKIRDHVSQGHRIEETVDATAEFIPHQGRRGIRGGALVA